MRSRVTNVLRFKTPLERLNSLPAVGVQSRSRGADSQPPQREEADRRDYHPDLSIKPGNSPPSEPECAKPVFSREKQGDHKDR
jgi:hypothetical protein